MNEEYIKEFVEELKNEFEGHEVEQDTEFKNIQVRNKSGEIKLEGADLEIKNGDTYLFEVNVTNKSNSDLGFDAEEAKGIAYGLAALLELTETPEKFIQVLANSVFATVALKANGEL